MSLDVSSYPAALVILIYVGVTVTLLKCLLEKTFLPPSNDLHDPALRILAVALGIGFSFAYALVPAAVINEVSVGGFAGLSALGYFHLLTNTSSSGDLSSLIAQAQKQQTITADPTVQAAVEAASSLVGHVVAAQSQK